MEIQPNTNPLALNSKSFTSQHQPIGTHYEPIGIQHQPLGTQCQLGPYSTPTKQHPTLTHTISPKL